MIRVTTSGNTKRTEAFLDAVISDSISTSRLDQLAKRGVVALQQATPRDSGNTAQSWTYEILREAKGITIWWVNTNNVNGFNVAIGLQYGHGTGTGGYVKGQDYINPTLKPIFDSIADEMWKEVQKA